jgi:hypothetical protein
MRHEAVPEVPDLKYLTVAELNRLERDLERLGTPPDNCFRRMIREVIRERRRRRAKPHRSQIVHKVTRKKRDL